MYIQSALLSVSEQMISDLVLPEYALVALTGINSEIIGSGLLCEKPIDLDSTDYRVHCQDLETDAELFRAMKAGQSSALGVLYDRYASLVYRLALRILTNPQEAEARQGFLNTRQKDVIGMLQQPNTQLVSLKGMDQASAASGNIVLTPGEPKAVLILRNLPILPKGQFYQLWSVVNGEKIPWEQFNANNKGAVFVKLSLPSNFEMTDLVVTVEVLSAPKGPAGPLVMSTNL
jgi:hypothetical protein